MYPWDAIKPLWEFLVNVYESGSKRVEIRGGSHMPDQYLRSRVYANCLHRALQKGLGGERVTMSIEGNHPDEDFFYISHAQKIVVSAGGYSNIMGRLVERRGGTVLGRSFGIHWDKVEGRNPNYVPPKRQERL